MNSGGVEPLSPRRKWQAITVATLLLVPAFWALLIGIVASSAHVESDAPNPTAALALGLALVPFVFIVLAFMSAHPRAPIAVLKAMGLAIVIGIPVSALAGDAVTGIVAGVGAGGIVALRRDDGEEWKPRAIAVAIGSLYTVVLVRTAGALALLPAPIFPLTGIGLADHLTEWRRARHAPSI
jgi:hypothetical protein